MKKVLSVLFAILLIVQIGAAAFADPPVVTINPAEGGSAENSSAEAGNLGLLEEALTIRVKGAAVGRLEEDSSLSGQIRLHEKRLEVVRLEKARRIASGKLEDIPD